MASMSMEPRIESLQSLVDSHPNFVNYLRNDTPGPHSRTRTTLNPIPLEFSNWRDEQIAWRESAVLFDQTHHMPELFLNGPDAITLLNHVGVNSLENLTPGIAKQFVGCNERGELIGDCVLYVRADGIYELVSGAPLLNWIEFLATTGDWDVELRRDNNTSDNPTGRRTFFRYQLDGPNAPAIFEQIVQGDVPELRHFRAAMVRVGGIEVQVLRHGMAGRGAGFELSGPYDRADDFLAVVLEAGRDHGLRRGGMKAYFSTSIESGWIAYPLPAIYTGDEMRRLREWLPASSWEGRFQLGGSFVTDEIADYYTTPFDHGYDKIVKFDHDFVGREALEALAPEPPRTRVTLVWNPEDVLDIVRSLFDEHELPYKYFDFPNADYASTMPRDQVLDAAGDRIGLSIYTGYSRNERKALSLAIVDRAHAAPGTEVSVLWGEPGGGSRKPNVERHRQRLVRATVAPAPYGAR